MVKVFQDSREVFNDSAQSQGLDDPLRDVAFTQRELDQSEEKLCPVPGDMRLV